MFDSCLLFVETCFDLDSTMDPKSFDYQFLATLHEMGQGIRNDGDKRGRRKGC